jgi:hypothetical protein
VLGRVLVSFLQDRLCHLFNEERNPVGTLNDFLPNTCWDRSVAGDQIDELVDFGLPQPAEREGGDIRAPDPGWLKFQPEALGRPLADRRGVTPKPRKRASSFQ